MRFLKGFHVFIPCRQKFGRFSFKKGIILGLFLLGGGGCTSYEQFKYITEEYEMPNQVYNVPFVEAWASILQVMEQFDIAHKSQEAGVIKTMWIDNTVQLNFVDSFGTGDKVKAAKFKIILNAVKGHRGRREVTKVTVYKRQLIEQDILQGWKEIPSDNIQENTLLYRIARNVLIDQQLKAIEKKREEEQLRNF